MGGEAVVRNAENRSVMTTSLDAYRSDREQLLARVKELEAEVERLSAKVVKSGPFELHRRCVRCGTENPDENPLSVPIAPNDLGWTHPVFCRGFSRLVCWFKLGFESPNVLQYDRWRKPHFHQRCTACGARWVVDAEGWRFD